MTMYNAGYVKRTTRRVNVLRGFDGCNPNTFTRTAPIKDSVTVVSGALLALVTDGSGGFEWDLYDADVVAHRTSIPYIALSDGEDTDVSASGLLPALSCAGKFEIETPLYAAGTYVENTPIVAGGTATKGTIAAGTVDVNGNIEAGALIGHATRGGYADLNASVADGAPATEVNAEDGKIVTFITNWTPAVVNFA